MYQIKFIAGFFLLAITLSANAQRIDTAGTRAYIQQYKDIAIEEMQRAGIPASITLAQGIHESGLGKSYLAQNTNNHFGIKCHENWTGKTFKYTDDAPDECFRVYDNAAESYKDHTDFLRNRPRYAALFQLDKDDYKGWAYGLKKAGYATNPRYPDILIKTIEDFQLQLFDKGATPDYINTAVPIVVAKAEDEEMLVMDSIDMDVPQNTTDEKKEDEQLTVDVQNIQPQPATPPSEKKIIKVNGRKAVKISQGETVQLIGSILSIPNTDLLFYNDITDAAAIQDGDLLFIQQKKKRNREGKYTVTAGDNMWNISQNKGVRLPDLYRHNRMEPGEEPAVGEIIFLKGASPAKPNLQPKNEPKPEVPVAQAPPVTMISPVAPSTPAPTTTNTNVETPKFANEPKWPASTEKVKVKETTSTTSNTPPPATTAITEEPKTVYPAVIDYSKLPKSTNGMHTVIKGDTMYNICKRYNISIAQVMEWNNLSDQSVKLGQVLKIQP